jgi:uncharacterized protein
VVDHGVAGSGDYQAARDALLRLPPRLRRGVNVEAITEETETLEAAKKLAVELDASILPIQGPPGSGKTFTGAQMVLSLLKAGKRVGVTANSHKVIGNFLSTICKAAEETHQSVSIVQKVTDFDDGFEHGWVKVTTDNTVALESLSNGEAQIGAGTSWLWSREEFANSVDVLYVDEAGQMSLANVLAISQAANRTRPAAERCASTRRRSLGVGSHAR